LASAVAVPGTTLSVVITPADVRMMVSVFIMPMGQTRFSIGYRVGAEASDAWHYFIANNLRQSRQTGVLSNFLLQPNSAILVVTGTFTIAVNVFGHPFYGKVIADTI